MQVSEFYEDYNDLARDVMYAGHETYERKLRDWFDLIDNAPFSRDRIKELESGHEYDAWMATAAKGGSMVGSGTPNWSKDRRERLGQELMLFRHFSKEEFAWSDFSHEFMWAGSRFDDNISLINREIFEPFVRSLLKDIQRNLRAAADEGVPAADRIVNLDHNSQSYRDAIGGIVSVREAVESSNEIGAGEAAARERTIAELDAGQRLLLAMEVRAVALWQVLYPALKWVAEHSAGTLIAVAVTATIAMVAALLGISIPGL